MKFHTISKDRGLEIFCGDRSPRGEHRVATRVIRVGSGKNKVLVSIREAISACGLSDGMGDDFLSSLSGNGDYVLNMVLDAAARMVSKVVAPTGMLVVGYMTKGVVTGICTN